MSEPAVSGAPVPDIPATDPGKHGLAQNAVSLLQTTVFSIASSAPTAAMTITFAALIVVSARGGAIAIIITIIPMLIIANSFRRLNSWEANCGAQYVWVGRAVGPRLGLLTGWVVLAALMFGTVATVLPVGPSFLDLVGLNASSQLGAALSATILSLIVMVLAIAGITLTARFQLTLAAVEYGIVVVLTVIGLWQTFVTHPAGFVHPSWAWLSPTGVGGKGSLISTLLLSVFLIAGWDASLYVNEETKNRSVNPGKAVMISVAALGLFYAVMTIAFQGVAPVAQINAHAAEGLSFAARRVAGSPGEKAMSFAILLSAVATTQIGFVELSRISYAMSTDRLVPKVFGQLHPRFRTPAFGTIFFAVVTIIVTWASVYSSSVADAFNTIVATTGVLYGAFYAISAVTNTWYYRSQLRSGAGNLISVGLLPLAAAGFLVWIIVKSVAAFSRGENLTLAGVLVTGIAVLAFAQVVKRSPFFRLRPVKYETGGPTR
jgi:amino acid transporter